MTTKTDIIDQAVTESGSYEIIRKRLETQGKALTEQISTLNSARLDEFGSTAMSVIARLRVRTENNCIARDI
ncbi:MAG: DNA repair ATPase, partial [Cocleimonas sp.]|nr:DNA repair ATPase [Cocleimonas sp.]